MTAFSTATGTAMRVITWNIQWGCGMDGRVDLARIVAHARAMADFDVICMQEIADNFPGLEGNDDRDQFAELQRLLPGYEPVTGYGVDVAGDHGRRSRFGNAIFSRYPVTSIRRHALPWPPDPAAKASMPRVAVEATLSTPFGALRLVTTHLEYYSKIGRGAQARRLRELHDEACRRASSPAPASSEANTTFRPAPQTPSALFVGDFNFPVTDPSYEEMQRPVAGGGPALRDAWPVVHGSEPHAATFCVHDDRYSKHPYCCDFAFVSADIAPRVRGVHVDTGTQLSDHQPLLVDIDER
jgi:endonuclease/exonuclease/phosphatase family metal-dependent hydrolase